MLVVLCFVIPVTIVQDVSVKLDASFKKVDCMFQGYKVNIILEESLGAYKGAFSS